MFLLRGLEVLGSRVYGRSVEGLSESPWWAGIRHKAHIKPIRVPGGPI